MATVMPSLLLKLIKEKFDPSHVVIVHGDRWSGDWRQVQMSLQMGCSSPVVLWYGNSHISATVEKKLSVSGFNQPLAVLVSTRKHEVIAWTEAWNTWHYVFHFDPVTVEDSPNIPVITVER